jgi:hypothetical protein
MQPQVALIARPTTEPRMKRWTSLSTILGNEPLAFRFTADFFTWWRRQLVVIEDFPYVGVDFRGSCYEHKYTYKIYICNIIIY